jgi:hypothetical protein
MGDPRFPLNELAMLNLSIGLAFWKLRCIVSTGTESTTAKRSEICQVFTNL